MKIHFTGASRHPNGTVVAALALEMTPEIWDVFARKMQDCYGADDKPDQTKTIRVFAELFNQFETEIANRNLVVPVEHISPRDFARVARGGMALRLNGNHEEPTTGVRPRSSKGR